MAAADNKYVIYAGAVSQAITRPMKTIPNKYVKIRSLIYTRVDFWCF